MKLEQAGRPLVSRITLNTSTRKKCGYPAGQQVSPARCTCMSSCTVEEILGRQVFFIDGTHVLARTCYIKPLIENYQTRQEISVVSLEFSTEKENDRERVISQLSRRRWTGGTVCLLGSSGEASAEQTRTPDRGMSSCSCSERDGETDMHGCVGKRQSNPCIDRNLLYLQVPSDETILSLIIFFL